MPESLLAHFQDRGALCPFVFTAVHQRENPLDGLNRESLGYNFFPGTVILKIQFQNLVKSLVIGQTILVLLTWTQLCRRGLGDRVDGDNLFLPVQITGQLINFRLIHVPQHGKRPAHIPEIAMSSTPLTLACRFSSATLKGRSLNIG